MRFCCVVQRSNLCQFVLTFYFSLSFTGMTDDEILRAEMVSQLCMNDRTHSALLDLVSFNTQQLLLKEHLYQVHLNLFIGQVCSIQGMCLGICSRKE